LPEHAPFDGIVVTAGGTSLPKPFLEQLSMGGRIVIPLGESMYGQAMYRFTKLPEALQVENLGGFAFVPLIGLSIAVSTLVGQKLGENRPQLAARAAWTALTIGLFYTAFFALLYIGVPSWLLLRVLAG